MLRKDEKSVIPNRGEESATTGKQYKECSTLLPELPDFLLPFGITFFFAFA
jgi:hypothetical protein